MPHRFVAGSSDIHGLQKHGVSAHSTRGLAASWVVLQKASLTSIFKVSSWSSAHTLLSHCCIKPPALTSVNFGCTVLEMALLQDYTTIFCIIPPSYSYFPQVCGHRADRNTENVISYLPYFSFPQLLSFMAEY